MLTVFIWTKQQNDKQYWQEQISSIWDVPFDIKLSNDLPQGLSSDLIILDFSGEQANTQGILTALSPNLVGKNFVIVTDKKDGDLAIEAIKLGAVGFLVKPLNRSEFKTTLDRVKEQAAKRPPSQKKSGKLITLLSYKGGTGVSTTTANLGYAISLAYQKKTLIIDAAGFSNHVTVLLNSVPKCTLVDICKQEAAIDELYLSSAVKMVNNNLGLIGGLIKTEDLGHINMRAIASLIEVARSVYDYILIDTSTHMLDEMTMYFIQQADDLLLMTTFDLLTIKDNKFYIQALKEAGIDEHKIKPIVNRHNWYMGSLEPELIQKQINHPLFHALPNDWNLCMEATNYGRPIMDLAPESQLATSYRLLAGRVTGLDVADQTQQTAQEESNKSLAKKKGILNWF